MTYHQINLPDHTIVNSAGIPANLLGLSDEVLSDLGRYIIPPPPGMANQGWWSGHAVTPTYDPTRQALAGTVTLSADVANRTVTETADLRALTDAEKAALLAAAQQAKIADLTASCAAQIVGGFTSSALGSPHTYPSKIPVDQINLMGSVTDSLLPALPAGWTTPFWCADAQGNWSFAAHTAAQIQQAGRDGKLAVANAQTKLASLSAQVMATTSFAVAQAVSW